MYNHNTASLIYHRADDVYDKVLATLADQLIPQLKQAIDDSAHTVLTEFGSAESPFAQDAARELLMHKLVELLMLAAVDDLSDVLRPHQLTSTHCRHWFKTE